METIQAFKACRATIQWSGTAERAVYLPMEQDGARALFAQLPEGTALITLDETDWNRDFSPWAAPAVFRDGDFSGGVISLADVVYFLLFAALMVFFTCRVLTARRYEKG